MKFSLKIPKTVVVVINHRNAPLIGSLFDEEEGIISNWKSNSRKESFRMGRITAHSAMQTLGCEPTAILKGSRGEPLWSNNIVGSISHSDGYCVAALGLKNNHSGIGIDIQKLTSGFSTIGNRVLTKNEQEWVNQGDDDNEKTKNIRTLMMFSAKESIFKALYPIYLYPLGFMDAELSYNNELQCFFAEISSKNINLPPFHKTIRIEVGLETRFVYSAVVL